MAPNEVARRLAQIRAVLEAALDAEPSGGSGTCLVPIPATNELIDALTQAIRAVVENEQRGAVIERATHEVHALNEALRKAAVGRYP